MLAACGGPGEIPPEEADPEFQYLYVQGKPGVLDLPPASRGTPCPGESKDAQAAREAVAVTRAWVSLPPLSCDLQAAAAAQAHCVYLDANHLISHVEEKGKPSFYGVTLQDRLAKAGFKLDASGEVVATLTGRNAVLGARGFMNSVYHRAFFLRAESTVVGYGGTLTCATLDFGRPKTPPAPVAVVWPPDGAVNVPRAFQADRELPNPVPGSKEVGSPISWIGNGALTKIEATLTGPKGKVDGTIITHENDPGKLVRVGEVHFVPKAVFAKKTSYTMTFRATSGKAQLLFRTTFTTGD